MTAKQCNDVDDLKIDLSNFLDAQPTEFFHKSIYNLNKRLEANDWNLWAYVDYILD